MYQRKSSSIWFGRWKIESFRFYRRKTHLKLIECRQKDVNDVLFKLKLYGIQIKFFTPMNSRDIVMNFHSKRQMENIIVIA